MVDINIDDFFSFNNLAVTRGHQYKLYKNRTVCYVRATFFSERVISVWNSLPKDVYFSSLLRLKRSIQRVDFSSFTVFWFVMHSIIIPECLEVRQSDFYSRLLEVLQSRNS